MPLCKKKQEEPKKLPHTAQKIVIPKGMINPNETTIIEIPARLHDQPLVIAKRKINSPTFTSETYNKVPSTSYEEEPSCYIDDSMINKKKQQQRSVQIPPDNYSAFTPDYNSSVREVRITIIIYTYCHKRSPNDVSRLESGHSNFYLVASKRELCERL